MVDDTELEAAKAAIFELQKEKLKIESSLEEQKKILDINHSDMTEPLVDNEGYPRNDKNVYEIRKARHSIILLRNDHMAIMKQLEEGLHKIHALILSGEDKPFLEITSLLPESPAAQAGIQLNDLVLEVGPLNYKNYKSREEVYRYIQENVDKPICVKVKRGSNVFTFELVPHLSIDNDLIGCNVAEIRHAC